uniref:Cadherin domain-containing protein n=1 Tax=Kryptolebias marmoratus TaxID=37003 RepID=A0A3Q3A4M4_KRYMA
MDHRVNLKWWTDFFLCALLFGVSFGEVRYVFPEEMQRGSVIGNVARDLGLQLSELHSRRARVVAEGTSQLCELDTASGNLLISQRIDREELCAQATVCILQFQLLLEDPLQAFSLVLDIADINDNSPAFATGEIKLDLVESTVLGRRFPLESAHDPDLVWKTTEPLLHCSGIFSNNFSAAPFLRSYFHLVFFSWLNFCHAIIQQVILGQKNQTNKQTNKK